MEKKESRFNAKTFAVFAAILVVGYMAGYAAIGARVDEADNREKYAKGELEFDEASPFVLPSLRGEMVSLKTLRGQWVFINFWATWCVPCVVEMPEIEKLHQELKEENFKVVGINVENLPAAAVRKFADNLKLTFTILLDTHDVTGPLYGITSLPFSIVVNPSGEVVATARGVREWGKPPMIEYMRGLMKDASAKGKGNPVKPI